MKVVVFEPEHLVWLMEQPGHEHLRVMTKEDLMKLRRSNYAHTILDDNGDVILCGGVVEYWKGRGEGWVSVNRALRKDFVKVVHIVRKFLDLVPIRRIESAVEVDSKFGHRFMRVLGFKKEAETLHAYLPGGQDCSLYALVKPWLK